MVELVEQQLLVGRCCHMPIAFKQVFVLELIIPKVKPVVEQLLVGQCCHTPIAFMQVFILE